MSLNKNLIVPLQKWRQREHLPPQLQEKEFPNDRKPLKEIVMEGQYMK
jgi:hypothetical protein